jgi:hypothetical protein
MYTPIPQGAFVGRYVYAPGPDEEVSFLDNRSSSLY